MQRWLLPIAGFALWLVLAVQAWLAPVLLDDWFALRYWRDHAYGVGSLALYWWHNYFHYNPRIGDMLLAAVDGSRLVHLALTPVVEVAALVAARVDRAGEVRARLGRRHVQRAHGPDGDRRAGRGRLCGMAARRAARMDGRRPCGVVRRLPDAGLRAGPALALRGSRHARDAGALARRARPDRLHAHRARLPVGGAARHPDRGRRGRAVCGRASSHGRAGPRPRQHGGGPRACRARGRRGPVRIADDHGPRALRARCPAGRVSGGR